MRALPTIILGEFLLACAIEPRLPPTPELEAARSAYHRAAEDLALRTKASLQLSEAAGALERAEAALVRGEDSREIALLSYLVERRVLIARWAASQGQGPSGVAAAFPTSAGAEERSPERVRELADLQARALDAESSTRGLVVTLSRSLFDGSELKPLAQTMLDRVVEFLKIHPGRHVTVEGHTDDMGALSYNERVSRERAEAVGRYLQHRGVSPSQISTAGLGPSMPRVSNTSRAGRRINRRVEIVIEAPGP